MSEKSRFRDPDLAAKISRKIRAESPEQPIRICHVCGTHEWTITHFGIRDMLPANLEVIAGPGCPVCIVPSSEIDEATELAKKDVVITCFGDILRVRGSGMSLLDAKAQGADVRIVYSIDDAAKMAQTEPKKDFCFFAVGFETTAPSTAARLLTDPPENFSVLTSHRLIPPAMKFLADLKDLQLHGFIAPGHASTIIGMRPYEIFPEYYKMPTVVAGFEPVDILLGIYMIVKQMKDRDARLENEYARAVRSEGNTKAQRLMEKVFSVVDGNWRGLGIIPASSLSLRREYEAYDARRKYQIKTHEGVDIQKGCRCHLVVIGKIKPTECSLFMKTCTPSNPVGACMVSSEGTCRIWGTSKNA